MSEPRPLRPLRESLNRQLHKAETIQKKHIEHHLSPALHLIAGDVKRREDGSLAALGEAAFAGETDS